jgi:hypothetical protein
VAALRGPLLRLGRCEIAVNMARNPRPAFSDLLSLAARRKAGGSFSSQPALSAARRAGGAGGVQPLRGERPVCAPSWLSRPVR